MGFYEGKMLTTALVLVLVVLAVPAYAGKLPHVSTLAGSGNRAYKDGIGTHAEFMTPYTVSVSSDGSFAIIAEERAAIRKITLANNKVTTMAGSVTETGFKDATGTHARFGVIQHCALSKDDKFVLCSDMGNYRIRKIMMADQKVTTLAGSGGQRSGGHKDGASAVAKFSFGIRQVAISKDSSFALVADGDNSMIRRIEIKDGTVSTIAGAPCTVSQSQRDNDGGCPGGFADGTGTNAKFNRPTGVFIHGSGSFALVSDSGNNRIRKITLADKKVTTVVGTGARGVKDGIGTRAVLQHPMSICFSGDDSFALFVGSGTQLIRKLQLSNMAVTTLAGTHNQAGHKDGGPDDGVKFMYPNGVTVSNDGSFALVADTNSRRLRKVTISFRCTCDNGTPASGAACKEDGASCTKCKSGYTLNSDKTACASVQKAKEAEKAKELDALMVLIGRSCVTQVKACSDDKTCAEEQKSHIADTIANLGSLYSGDFSKASTLFKKLVACGQDELFKIQATQNYNGKITDIAERRCPKEWATCTNTTKCTQEIVGTTGKLFTSVDSKTKEYAALGNCALAAKNVEDDAELKQIWALIEATCPTDHKLCSTDSACSADLDALIRSASGPPTPRNTAKLWKGYLCVDGKQRCAEACISGKRGTEKSCQADCGWGKRATSDVLEELAVQCPTQLKLCTAEKGCMELFTKAHETDKVSKPSTALTMLLKCNSGTSTSTATSKFWASKDSLNKKCPSELKTCTGRKECVGELVKALQLSSPPRSGTTELMTLLKCYYAVEIPKIGCECHFGKPKLGLACYPGDPMKCAKCLPGYRLKKTDGGGVICFKATPRFKLPPEERKALIEAQIKAVQEKKAAQKAKAAAVLAAKIAARDKRSPFEKSKEKIDKEKVSAKLTLAADIKKIAPGTKARKDFEDDFKKKMAKTLEKSKVSEDDIAIDAIKEKKDGDGDRRRRQLQDSSLTVDFSILAPKTAAEGSTTVLKDVTDLKSSEAKIELSVAGETVSVVPKSAVAEVASKNEDIDCTGTWSECLESCTRIFTRTTAQSNDGADCPTEEPCIPFSGKCDLNSKAAAFRTGEEERPLFSGQVEAFEDGTVCRKGGAGTGQRYVCDRE